jgi:hypothetical protein
MRGGGSHSAANFVMRSRACARIGGDVDCYSLIAVDFHHVLLPVSRRSHHRYVRV